MKDLKRKLSFIWYLLTNRNERFWQALKNWSGYSYIPKADFDSFNKDVYVGLEDNYYFE